MLNHSLIAPILAAVKIGAVFHLLSRLFSQTLLLLVR